MTSHAVLFALAALALLGWIYLLAARGAFWRGGPLRSAAPRDKALPPRRIVAVVPARDEAATIGRTVTSLLRQDYEPPLVVIVIDDGSVDGTAEVARRAARAVPGGEARLHMVAGLPLPAGWSGKVWAMHQGIRFALGAVPEATDILFTDADIEHDLTNVRRLVATAERGGHDLVSLMVRLQTNDAWARLLIPAFVFFFQKLYPFAWVNDPRRATAAAAGGCMLVRRTALERTGGIESIRGNLIDDCALARRIKQQGPIWLGLTTGVHSLRPYEGLGDIWRMVARTAFEQLNHSAGLVLAAVLGMGILYLAPPFCLAAGLLQADVKVATLGGLAWLLMAIAYRPTLALYGEPAWRSVTLPLAGLLYAMMTVDSLRRAWRGQGGGWKGRAYPQGR